jgi:eukaryotic-like serine/threonine-protein kinase
MTEASSGAELLNHLAHEFAERYRRGQRPALSEYTDKYPDLAAEIRELFPAMVVIEQFGQPTGAGAPGPAADSPMPEQLGEYRLLREVGRGGMGIVYEAVQEPLGRHVALKVLPFQSLATGTQLERFQREARAAANLHHTNIVSVFGVGEDHGIHYYAMQFIQGQSLDSVLRELRRLRRIKRHDRDEPVITDRPDNDDHQDDLSCGLAASLLSGRFAGNKDEVKIKDNAFARYDGTRTVEPQPAAVNPSHPAGSSESSFVLRHSSLSSQTEQQYFRSVARLGLQVAEALVYAHGQGVLHRDIKPSNLLLDTQGTVWLADFGLAKAADSVDLTGTGDIVGTLRYMAPERFQGRADNRSDVYGLGVTLHELLTLHPAHADGNRARLVERILREEPARPRKLDPHIPRDLETIVLKALAKEPSQRYRSAQELAEDLRRFLADRPVRARRVSLIEQTWRWCHRNPTVASLLTLVGLLLVAVAGVSTYSAIRTDLALHRTAAAERQARLREADALIGQAHGIRLSRRPGQRFAALEALGKAASIGRELDQTEPWFDRLRNEAIAALALPDVHITQEWEVGPPTISGVELSDDFELYVRADDKGLCSVHTMAGHAEIARLPELGEPVQPVFGVGRVLGVRGLSSRRFQLWDLAASEPVLRFDERGVDSVRFRQNGRLVALGHRDGSISVYDASAGRRVWRLAPSEIVEGIRAELHPSLPLVAAVSYVHRVVQVRDLKSGAIVATAVPPWSKGNGDTAWSPDGRVLIVTEGDGGRIQQYAFDPGSSSLRPIRTINGPELGAPKVVYSPTGDRFVCRGWNGKVALVDAVSGQVLFTTHAQYGASLRFDRTGRRLAGARVGEENERIGLWSVADGREYRALVDDRAGEAIDHNPDSPVPSIHPGGRLAAAAGRDVVVLFDLEAGRSVAHLIQGEQPRPFTQTAFDGAGNLLTNGFAGAFRWPVVKQESHPTPSGADLPREQLRIGPPERLPFHPGNRNIAASLDGRVIAQAMYAGYGMGKYAGGWILHPGTAQPRQVDSGAGIVCASVSPDGRWVAFGVNQGGIRVYNSDSCVRVLQSPAKHGDYCRFSPDGRWLLTNVDGGQVYSVDTWRPGPRLGPGTPWHATADLAVLGQANGIYRLVELTTGRELARLEDPEQGTGAAAFTPDGLQLVVTAQNGLRVWNLRRIREELARLGLDWDGPPRLSARAVAPGSQPDMTERQAETPELQIELDLGDLGALPKYSMFIALFPFWADAYYQRGLANSHLGRWTEALRDFNMTLSLKPDDAQAHCQRGLVYARTGRHQEAVADFSRTLEQQPACVAAIAGRARAYNQLHEWQRAADDYTRAIQVKANDALSWHQRGHCREKLGRADEALADFTRSLELEPRNALFWHCRAIAYTRLKLWDKAVSDFSRALRQAPDYRPSRLDRAHTYCVLGQWDNASTDLARLERDFPAEPELRSEYASVLLLRGDHDGYRKICRRLVQTASQASPNDLVWIARIPALAPNDVVKPALLVQLAQQVVAHQPKDCLYQHIVALALYRAGQWDEAVGHCQKSMEFDPNWNSQVLNWLLLAMSHQRMEHSKEARRWLAKVREWMDQGADEAKGAPIEHPMASWSDRLEVRILLRELEALLNDTEGEKRGMTTGPGQSSIAGEKPVQSQPDDVVIGRPR